MRRGEVPNHLCDEVQDAKAAKLAGSKLLLEGCEQSNNPRSPRR